MPSRLGALGGAKGSASPVMTKLLTTEDVADLLSLKPSTIRKWVHLQEIPCVRLGRAVRFEYGRIVEWVREVVLRPGNGIFNP